MLHCYQSVVGYLFTGVPAKSYLLNDFERTLDTLETFFYLVCLTISGLIN